uniref:Uncharacterized protein n=1 Tax=Steinernema glaseri TaxID=37863 RepID=A0A1I7YA27_9BILA
MRKEEWAMLGIMRCEPALGLDLPRIASCKQLQALQVFSVLWKGKKGRPPPQRQQKQHHRMSTLSALRAFPVLLERRKWPGVWSGFADLSKTDKNGEKGKQPERARNLKKHKV